MLATFTTPGPAGPVVRLGYVHLVLLLASTNVAVAILFFLCGKADAVFIAITVGAYNVWIWSGALAVLISGRDMHATVALWIVTYTWLECAGYAAAWFAGRGLISLAVAAVLLLLSGLLECSGIIFEL